MKSDLDGKIRFQFPEQIYQNFLQTPEDVKIAARNTEIASEVEAYGRIWIKQIDMVLCKEMQYPFLYRCFHSLNCFFRCWLKQVKYEKKRMISVL